MLSITRPHAGKSFGGKVRKKRLLMRYPHAKQHLLHHLGKYYDVLKQFEFCMKLKGARGIRGKHHKNEKKMEQL